MKKKEKRITRKLLNKYRLVILNEDTFEEQISFKINRLNVFVLTILLSVVLIAFTIFLTAFTPLREYIPGYSPTKLNRKANVLAFRSDSLEMALRVNQNYLQSIKKVLLGELKPSKLFKDTVLPNDWVTSKAINLTPSVRDSALREEVTREDRYSLFEHEKPEINLTLFPPVKGAITSSYSPSEKHFGADVAVPKGTPVKAVAMGTVIFAEWTATTGYVLILEHTENLLSVYKHNASLSKAQGDRVVLGEVIAIAGSTGSLSTGPHLHFELWRNESPINPTLFIDFE